MRRGDKGMPRANCPARMGKVKFRKPWRVGEPLIVLHPMRALYRKASYKRLLNRPKCLLDYFAAHPSSLKDR
jgi:hypothetical protein